MKQGKSALALAQKYHPNVTKVVDAKKSLTIKVLAADCKSARSKSPGNCAMARACERSHDGAVISMTVAYIVDGNTATRYKVPASISREIVSFDRSHNFAAGEYTLKAPTAADSLARFRGPNTTKRPHHKSKGIRKHYHQTAGIRSL